MEKLKLFEGKSNLLILSVATSAVESKDECLNSIVGPGYTQNILLKHPLLAKIFPANPWID